MQLSIYQCGIVFGDDENWGHIIFALDKTPTLSTILNPVCVGVAK